MKKVINILPINDIRPHIESKHCLCNPKIEENGLIIIHNAYDGRDRREQYDEMMDIQEE